MNATDEIKRGTAELWIRDENGGALLLDFGAEGFTYKWAGRVHFRPWGDLLERYYGRVVARMARAKLEAV